MKKTILIITIVFTYLIASCSPPVVQQSQNQTSHDSITTPTFVEQPNIILENTPKIHSVDNNPAIDEIMAFALSPDWHQIWVYGYMIDNTSSIVYYVNAWLSDDGHGSLLTSQHMPQLLQFAKDRDSLSIADQNLSDGKLISSRIKTDWSNVENQWKYHPFEKSDRFMSYFLPIFLQAESQWEVIGRSDIVNREAWVIQNSQFRVWVDQTTGTLLRTEVFSQDAGEMPNLIMQVEEIVFNVNIPARTVDVVPTSNYPSSFLDQPFPLDQDIEDLPLDIYVVTRNTYDMSQGYLADLYMDQKFLGAVDLGATGLYCGRSYDWHSLAYLYQSKIDNSPIVRWVNISDVTQFSEIDEIKNPSAPIWSPTSPQFVVSGQKVGSESNLSTFLIVPDPFEIIPLGGGSLVPPAWSDDGKYVYSLDHTYENILVFDVEEKALIETWTFDAENWKITDENAWVTDKELNKKMPRNSFRYVEKCRTP